MSEIIKNFGKIMERSRKQAVDKSKDIKNVLKAKTDIYEEENKIKLNYRILGEKYYKIYGNDPDEELSEICSKIFLSKANIKRLKKEIINLKNK